MEEKQNETNTDKYISYQPYYVICSGIGASSEYGAASERQL